jgi:outer membrane protein insertion porin family/translocation and assembly module TamA
VLVSQRRLASLSIVQFVNIDARPPEGGFTPSIPVTVTLAENPRRRLEVGAGYGSEDRVRGSASWSHLNFLGNARQVTASVKWSSIDRGMRASLNQPYLYVRGLGLDVGVSNEQTYDSHTYGGRIGVSYRLGRRDRGTRRAAADLFRAAYVHEYLRYGIHADALDDLGRFDQLIALGLDPISGRGRGTKAAIAFDYERDASDNVLDPRRGYGVSLHSEHARPGLGGTFTYTEYLVEGRGYVPIGGSVLAGRGRLGVLRAAGDVSVPFSERYFLGGSTSLRGWGRYQVAPLSNGLPVGGRAMLDLSAEIRMPVRGRLGVVAFVDAGNVWPTGADISLGDLRRDAGAGIRYGTPVGLVRADLGVQLNQVPGLIVNGAPEARRWRLHFSIGQAF